MPLVLTGSDLGIEALVAAAKDPAMSVSIDPAALARMTSNRAFVDKLAARGDEVSLLRLV